jgi:hypothetical protein
MFVRAEISKNGGHACALPTLRIEAADAAHAECVNGQECRVISAVMPAEAGIQYAVASRLIAVVTATQHRPVEPGDKSLKIARVSSLRQSHV